MGRVSKRVIMFNQKVEWATHLRKWGKKQSMKKERTSLRSFLSRFKPNY